uniref:RNA-dependent RNA polymerase n=1 Tax=Exserohilum turcicum mitovirus 4 TaxID=3229028 RepID=A0AAU7YB44_9VIRU
MKNNNLFSNKLLLFRAKAFRLEKMFPVSQLRRALPINLQKLVQLSLGRSGSISERVRISYNFVSRILKMNKHHGSSFTVKWLKCNQVALQKVIGGDGINSLRALEPNIPLPRLINGFPAVINRRDRQLIRDGNMNILRFWLTLFGCYRILIMSGKTKLNTIYDPFSGDHDRFLDILGYSKLFNLFEGFKFKENLSPRTLSLSHKSSPSNSMSYRGIFTDWYLLNKGNTDQMKIKENIDSYLEVISEKWSLARWKSLERSMDSIIESFDISNFNFKRSCDRNNGLSQFAIKEEAAGKIRVFALIDSVTQSVLAPLHQSCFDLLREIPNDGTFNQDASVQRSIEKSKLKGYAYSFDLSSATDRLPRALTGSILSKIFGLPRLGEVWCALMADRPFCFSKSVGKKYPHLLVDQDNRYYYSVGQPMGGLSSWAGLAITHHWILQYCYRSVYNRYDWNTDYEILGDDIVIFDHSLAEKYLEVMRYLGLEINLNKSIVSKSLPVFEFAKRTIVNGVNVSSLSFQQMISQYSIGSRVADATSWVRSGLINTPSLFGSLVSRYGRPGDFKSMKSVGMEVLATLGLLNSKNLIEHRVVVESLINPQYKEDFDWDKATFSLPLRSSLKLILSVLKGEEVTSYPFSKEDLRKEVYDELSGELAAVVLQLALHKIKLLNRDYDKLINKSVEGLYVGKIDSVTKAGITGFFEDLIISLRSDLDVMEEVDRVESILYRHAKYPNVSVESAMKVLDQVESMIHIFTYKTEISRVRYETEVSPVIELVRKGVLGSKTRYWEIPSYS